MCLKYGVEMKTHKMVKRRWVIVAVVILVLIVVLGVLYLMQQDNLKAAANARRYTQDQLLEKKEANRQAVEKALEKQYPDLHVRDLTDQERAALRDGTLSREEIISALLGLDEQGHESSGTHTEPPSPTQDSTSKTPAPTEDPTPSQTTAPTVGPNPAPSAAPTETPLPMETPLPTETAIPEPEPPPPPDPYSEELASIVAEVYVMREEYIALLDGMMARAKAEYSVKPESERTHSKLVKWAAGYVTEAAGLEKECDARMDAVLAEVKALAEKYGEDTGIVDTLAGFYAEEKSIQKSLYIQELERRGIL